MTYRVAVAISGAVSLGSYEAGTLHELIKAFEEHNKLASDDSKIKIDVLTGASAGGMTAALIAHKLLYDPEMLRGDKTNAGYRAWVEMVDIQGLLTPHEGDLTRTSLLSSNFVGNIAHELITRRQAALPDVSEPHPVAAEEIKLGLAMANLNGVDYEVKVFSSGEEGLDQGKFVQTRFQDRFTRTLAGPYSKEVWNDIILAARGCGAFPVAFSPIGLFRNWQNEPLDYRDRGASPFTPNNTDRDHAFYYMDGGAFNNYPLGMARALADRIDKTPEDYEKRFYIYISPSAKESVQDLRFHIDENTSMAETAKRMVKSVFWQGRFQEWMQIDSVNEKIKRLDDHAASLASFIANMTEQEIAATQKVFDAMLLQLYSHESDVEENLQRLAVAYRNDSAQIDLNTEAKAVWLKGVAVLEKSGDLNNREQMKVYTITANKNKLASEKLAAFMGFFDENLREHDYLLGRVNGMRMVQHILNCREDALIRDKHLPLAVASRTNDIAQATEMLSEMDLGHADMHDVNNDIKKAVYQRVKERTRLWLKAEGVGWFFRTGIWFFSRVYVKQGLKLTPTRILGLKLPYWLF
ncbi:hypothetical protein DRW07_07595 [Alteromonas sediminis]|uniref:PNPLA domain-containing protein n=1 Tax=Alteromonas sediminis TaxID=2259342 RepID=A0A3N5Y8I3_9ALTE|nr:patatin-like phospholipase family protein [Alteromonas sediminis]RPJ67379.1 hypothetical protein DRW07_07595 [Alteromonas sediminis]